MKTHRLHLNPKVLPLIAIALILLISSTVLAGWTPPRPGLTHPNTSPEPSFNNYTDSLFFGYPDERAFSVVSYSNFASKGDSVNVEAAPSDVLIFHAYFNNSSTVMATGVRVATDSYYQNAAGKWVTLPFTTSQDIKHLITGDNTNPVTVTDTATITATSGQSYRLKFNPGTNKMWVRPTGPGGFYFVDPSEQENFFVDGVTVADRTDTTTNCTPNANCTFTGNFRWGDDQTASAIDQRIEFQYYASVELANADLRLTKTANKMNIGVGENVIFTLNYNNNGPVEARNVVITDDYDETRLSISSLPAGCTNNGSIITCTISADVASGAGGSIQYTATGTAVGPAMNTATITSLMGDPNMTNNTAIKTITVNATPIVSGNIVVNELAWAGSSISTADEWIELRNRTNANVDVSGYQITKRSGGNEVLMLTIPNGKWIPANGYFVISNYDAPQSAINIIPDYVTTAVDLSNTTLQVKLYNGTWNNGTTLLDTGGNAGAPLAGTNTPKASMARNSTPGDGTQAANWHTSLVSINFDPGITDLGSPGVANPAAPADLVITKTADDTTVNIGDTVTFTINYQNLGPSVASGARIYDDYEDNAFSSVSGYPAYCTDEMTVSGKRLNCNMGNLASGASGSFTYTASTAGATVGLARNIASIASTRPDPDPTNNTVTVEVNIFQPVTPGVVVFNELMWMGSSAGANDEWIELHNTSSFSADLSGLQITHLVGGVETPLLTIPAGKTIGPYRHFLISKYDASSPSTSLNVTPDVVDAAVTLEDSNLQLKLYNGVTLIDTADDGNGAPLAGSNGATKASMMRKWIAGDGTLAANWTTSTESVGFDVGATDLGTPGIGNFVKLIASGVPTTDVTMMFQNLYGEVISSFLAFKSSLSDGVNLSFGDVDHDGTEEIVATKNAGGTQVIEVEFDGVRIMINGRDYFPTQLTSNGLNVAACDLDGDGYKDEIVLGKKTNSNHVVIYEPNGLLVRYFTAFGTGTGVNVSCGDIDNDGVDEIVVGKETGGNQVILYEANGTQIRYFNAFGTGEGANVATGDIDNDGVDEIIVGKMTGGQEVMLFEPDGTMIRYFVAYTATGDGSTVSSLDIDGDNVDEIVVARETVDNTIMLYEPTGTKIRSFTGIPGSPGLNVSGGYVKID